MKNLTAIIINFLRDDYTVDCVKSLREQYPEIQILVGDQNKKTSKELNNVCKENGAEIVRLPYDCGLSRSRNILVEKVKTDYVLVGDNDFLYTDSSKVDKMLEFLENSNFDLIGGRIKENEVRNYQGFIDIIRFPNSIQCRRLNNQDIASKKLNSLTYEKIDLVFNFFVARTDILRKNKWEERIKIGWEHTLFFINLKKNRVNVAYSPEPIVLHKFQNYEKKEDYKFFRGRGEESKEVFFDVLGIDFFVDIHGKKTTRPKIDEKTIQKKRILEWIFENEVDGKVDSTQLNKMISKIL